MQETFRPWPASIPWVDRWGLIRWEQSSALLQPEWCAWNWSWVFMPRKKQVSFEAGLVKRWTCRADMGKDSACALFERYSTRCCNSWHCLCQSIKLIYQMGLIIVWTWFWQVRQEFGLCSLRESSWTIHSKSMAALSSTERLKGSIRWIDINQSDLTLI